MKCVFVLFDVLKGAYCAGDGFMRQPRGCDSIDLVMNVDHDKRAAILVKVTNPIAGF